MSNFVFVLAEVSSMDMKKSWLVDMLRTFFAFIDTLLYTVISWFFRAIFNLANFELYGMYEQILQRVYVILGIFMLFKVTISLITYLVNPDKINDKEQGASKLVTRVITVLVMLIGLPTFFSLATEAQNKLLPVIPRVIIGTSSNLGSDSVTGVSEDMSLTILKGFADVKEGCDNVQISSVGDFLAKVNDTCNGSKVYAYEYLFGISTLVGIIMIYVLFSLCIAVAIRAFKLIILRSIAPIPIVSYIDPKSSKDGAFASWVKTFTATWLELFIHLALIYFAIFIISYMLSFENFAELFNNISNFNGLDGVFVLVFLIIGLLMFARQAPKFIMDALGIKSKGNFMRMLGMGAAALGMGGSAVSAYRSSREANPNRSFLRNAGTALFSGLRSGIVGGSAMLDEKATIGSGITAQGKFNKNNTNMIESGATLGGRMSAFGQTIIMGETEADRYDRRLKRVADYDKMLKDHKGVIENRFDGSEDFVYESSAWKENQLNYNVVKRMINASNGDPKSKVTQDAVNWLQANGVDIAEFLANEDSIHKAGYSAYAKSNGQSSATNVDAVVYNSVQVTASGLKGAYVYEYDNDGNVIASHNLGDVDLNVYGMKDPQSGKTGVKGGMAQTSTETTQVKSSTRYNTAQANKNSSGSGK